MLPISGRSRITGSSSSFGLVAVVREGLTAATVETAGAAADFVSSRSTGEVSQTAVGATAAGVGALTTVAALDSVDLRLLTMPGGGSPEMVVVPPLLDSGKTKITWHFKTQLNSHNTNTLKTC